MEQPETTTRWGILGTGRIAATFARDIAVTPGAVLAAVGSRTAESAESFAREHISGALHLPHDEIDEDALAPWPADTLFVVYCAGPHCNAADRGAAKIAALGRPVKKMIGGTAGWLDEGFELVSS